ncbi:RagB/SusD family nutrient uptake outer membrane protein [Pedobacter nyackensis]|uniref:RagB/SusD family nutrient uptake outer membrane protein n=1 Tax=Pedobacter nyackensis TaxID=475255 RepID=UPI00292CE72C|nr:RagB/SusD family nutrient uptake outer membrane protein [Pedobacter nyackensis]
MKKIMICSFLIFICLQSCKKDPLDITPDGRITLEEVFKDEKQTEAYLNTVYNSIPSYFWRYQFYSFLAVITDEAQDGDVGNAPNIMSAQWINGGLTPSFNPLEFDGQGNGRVRYNTYWAGIRNANVFLENIDHANVPSPTNRNRMRAEAQVLRAFYYLELIKQFGPMPVVDKAFSGSFDYTSLTRPSFQVCTDFIVQNCDMAIASVDLPLRITIEAERGRFTKAIAYAVKSQALLYNASPLWNPGNDAAKWKAAADASRIALAALTENDNYELADNYGEYFLSQTDVNTSPRDKETIYERPEGGDPNFSTMNGIPSKTGANKSGTNPSQELVDAYDMKATGMPAITGYSDAEHLVPIINPASGYSESKPYEGRDPRFYATIWYNGASYDNIAGQIHTMETFVGGADQLLKTPPNKVNTHSGYYLRKFIDPKIQVGQSSNAKWKKYRLAELYLNYAEAENESKGATQDVYNAINKIRSRADMPDLPLGLNQVDMRERIRRERRVELAIEEHRFWDVRRWKILSQTDKLVTGMEITKTGANTFTYKRFVSERRNAWPDKYLIFPIPIGDAANIPDFGANQNPGW